MGDKKTFRLTLFALAIALGSITTHAFAQEAIVVKGIVADSARHSPIQFVNVVLKRNYRGTTTDKNGFFNLTALPTDTIQFSFVGYKTLELPVSDYWEPSVILLSEDIIILKSVTIEGQAIGNNYEELFAEEIYKHEKANKPLPFYYPKYKKDKILLARSKNEQARVKHYVDLLVRDDKVKNELMKKHRLTEQEYYDVLARFNAKNYAVMYYLTDFELLTMLYRFYDINSPH